MTKEKSILKNVLYKTLLNVFNIIVPIIIGPYAYRIMGPNLIGRISYAESIYTYFLIFASFGIYNYGLREVSRIRNDKLQVSSLFSSLFVISVAVNLIVTLGYFIFVFFNFRGTPLFPVLLLYGINLVLNIFYIEWLFEANESYNFIAIKTMVIRIVYIVLLFTLVRTYNDFLIYVSLNTMLFLLNYIVSFIYIKRSVKFNFSNLQIMSHVKSLVIVLVMSNANILYVQLDKIMLGSYLSEKYVGYYFTSQLITNIINALLLSIIYVTIPRLSHVIANESQKAYEKLLSQICKGYFAFLFPAAIGMFLLSKEIILLYGGVEFSPAIGVLKIFSIFMIVAGIEFIFTNQIFYVKKKEKISVVLIGCGGLLNLLIKYVLVAFNMLNPYTAIATTTLAYSCLIIVEYIIIRRKLKVNLNILSIKNMRYLIVSLLFIPIVYCIKYLISSLILSSVLSVISCGLVYLVILLLLKDELLLSILTRFNILKSNNS